eukprot:UN02469
MQMKQHIQNHQMIIKSIFEKMEKNAFLKNRKKMHFLKNGKKCIFEKMTFYHFLRRSNETWPNTFKNHKVKNTPTILV